MRGSLPTLLPPILLPPILRPALRVSVLAVALSFAADAATAQQPVRAPSGMLNAPVRSYVDLQFEQVVRQQYDLSCGAASVATLLRYYYGMDIGEQDVIDEVFDAVPADTRQRIEQAGFSMLELKQFGERRGFVAEGYRLSSAEDLAGLRVPAITLTSVRGYAHFVVVKGVRGGQVYIADPAFGNRARPLQSFADGWNKVVLVMVDPDRPVRSAFDLASQSAAPTRELVPLLDQNLIRVRRGAGEF